nr:peptidoglycan-binding protein [Brevundimonas vesicularis]
MVVVETKPNPVAALGAAALAATAAVLMAGVVIIGPGVQFNDPVMTISR